MNASLSLFIEKGYTETTTEDIVNTAGISRGLLYYHFKNKEDILYCLIENHSKPLLKNIDSIANNNDLTAIKKLSAFIEATKISPLYITEEEKKLQKIVNEKENTYLMDRFSYFLIDKLKHSFTQIIEQGISEGVFDVSNPKEIAHLLITGYVFLGNSICKMEQDEIGDKYITAFNNILSRTLKIKVNIEGDS